MTVRVVPSGPEPSRLRLGHRCVPLLNEPDLDHYPEFSRFFAVTFDLDEHPFAPPATLEVDSRPYALTFVGRSGRVFPCGVEIGAIVPGLEPLDVERADRDLWEILEWVVAGVGEPWTVEALRRTGAIYRVPAADGI